MRILLVEDEVPLADMVRRGLVAEGPHGGAVTHDGPSGLAAAGTGGRHDVVVLDIMLPGMSGYRVWRLREEENWVPVLMLTAKDGEYDVADGFDYGADDYLTKPFSFVVLLARLRSLVRRDTGPRPTVLEAGDLGLDPATAPRTGGRRRGRADTARVRVLEHLIAPRRRSSARTSCSTSVGRRVRREVNVVEVYVGYLRRKIDGRSGRAIETVRGVGYRMADPTPA